MRGSDQASDVNLREFAITVRLRPSRYPRCLQPLHRLSRHLRELPPSRLDLCCVVVSCHIGLKGIRGPTSTIVQRLCVLFEPILRFPYCTSRLGIVLCSIAWIPTCTISETLSCELLWFCQIDFDYSAFKFVHIHVINCVHRVRLSSERYETITTMFCL